YFLSSYFSHAPLDFHSFPTRRSSDLTFRTGTRFSPPHSSPSCPSWRSSPSSSATWSPASRREASSSVGREGPGCLRVCGDVEHLVLVLAVPVHDGPRDGMVAGRGDADDEHAGAVLLQLLLAQAV